MFNCYRIFYLNRLVAIVHSWDDAITYVETYVRTFNRDLRDYRFEAYYIERVGF